MGKIYRSEKKMNVVNTDKLSKWIDSNKDRLAIGQRGTLPELAKTAEHALGFKVSVNALRDLMAYKGIPTKRVGKDESERMATLVENERLRAENKKLTKILAMVAASDSLDPNLQDIVFESLEEDVREAIYSKTK